MFAGFGLSGGGGSTGYWADTRVVEKVNRSRSATRIRIGGSYRKPPGVPQRLKPRIKEGVRRRPEGLLHPKMLALRSKMPRARAPALHTPATHIPALDTSCWAGTRLIMFWWRRGGRRGSGGRVL